MTEQSYWVVEQFKDGRSQGYWDGGSSRSFVADIQQAVQFRRKQDVFWATKGWHWDDTQITEHIDLSALKPAGQERRKDADKAETVTAMGWPMERRNGEMERRKGGLFTTECLECPTGDCSDCPRKFGADAKPRSLDQRKADRRQPTAAQQDGDAQGKCETTLTERFFLRDCGCGTYPGNLGPCTTWLDNGKVRCTYCDHGPNCHARLSRILHDRHVATHPPTAARPEQGERPTAQRRIENLRRISLDPSVNNFARSICAEAADFLMPTTTPAGEGVRR